MPAASVTPAILTVRTECSGGPIAQQVEASQDLHGFNRLTILIHGYNNSACVAQHSYKDFLGLADVNDASVFALFGQLCAFYWPGDARFLGPLSYPNEIPKAKEAARILGEFLEHIAAGRGLPLEIRLVCHSLGNRVALELVKALLAANSQTIRFVGALLMAAAVKVSMVEDEQSLEPAALAAGDTYVLFSNSDKVLHFAFPPGEFLAGEGFGTAVGRTGEPTDVFPRTKSMDGFDHGSYWSGDATGTQVRAWLGLATSRTIDSNSLDENPPAVAVELPQRSTPSRSVGASISECHCD